jgi:hypothetical protein
VNAVSAENREALFHLQDILIPFVNKKVFLSFVVTCCTEKQDSKEIKKVFMIISMITTMHQ